MQPSTSPSPSKPKRKRKRPASVKTERPPVDDNATHWPSELLESEERYTVNASDPVVVPRQTSVSVFRGKCLYQSRKCENERALKRNGKAHNLCDEHRSKQNQHQRKFDAKKYSKRTPGHDGVSSGEEENEEEQERSESREETKKRIKTEEAAIQDYSDGTRSAVAVAAVAEDTDRRTFSDQTTKVHPHVELKLEPSTQDAVADQHYHHYAHSPHHSVNHESIRRPRPPPLHVARSPPSHTLPLPPLSQLPVAAAAVGGHVPSYSRPELLAANMLVPSTGRPRPAPHASPHGYNHNHNYSMLASTPTAAVLSMGRPRPSTLRAQSFDSGVTRISPVGGATLGNSGVQRQFQDQEQYQYQYQYQYQRQDEYALYSQQQHQHQQHRVQDAQSPLGLVSPMGRPDKLPSLQQLPLGQLVGRHGGPSHQSPSWTSNNQSQSHSRQSLPAESEYRRSPQHFVSSSVDPRRTLPGVVAPALSSGNAAILPPLAPLLQAPQPPPLPALHRSPAPQHEHQYPHQHLGFQPPPGPHSDF